MDPERGDAFQQWLGDSQRQSVSREAVYLRDVRHIPQWSEAMYGQLFTWPPGRWGRAAGGSLRTRLMTSIAGLPMRSAARSPFLDPPPWGNHAVVQSACLSMPALMRWAPNLFSSRRLALEARHGSNLLQLLLVRVKIDRGCLQL
jgi:hypothetical protein